MPSEPIIVAHRGASHEAPENTLAAFMLAWMQGADAIEGDFQLSQDGQIVCVHDPDTSRTANRKLVVARASVENLKALDAGSWFSRRWKDQRIPTLDEVLALMPEGKKLFLEIKSGEETLKPLQRALQRAGKDNGNVVLMSYQPGLIAAVRNLLPSHKTLLLVNRRRPLVGRNWQPSVDDVIQMLKESKADGANCNAHSLLHDPSLAKRVLDFGRELHVWTVNRPGNARKLIKMGVSSITTDRPGWLRQKLAQVKK